MDAGSPGTKSGDVKNVHRGSDVASGILPSNRGCMAVTGTTAHGNTSSPLAVSMRCRNARSISAPTSNGSSSVSESDSSRAIAATAAAATGEGDSSPPARTAVMSAGPTRGTDPRGRNCKIRQQNNNGHRTQYPDTVTQSTQCMSDTKHTRVFVDFNSRVWPQNWQWALRDHFVVIVGVCVCV
jgi:hypothetical protein